MNKTYGFLISVEAEEEVDAPSLQLIMSDALSTQGVADVDIHYLGEIEVIEDEIEQA